MSNPSVLPHLKNGCYYLKGNPPEITQHELKGPPQDETFDICQAKCTSNSIILVAKPKGVKGNKQNVSQSNF